MSGGVRVEVTLLDGRKLEFSVGVRLLTQELMSLVTSHFALRESHYFALAFKDNSGHFHWLLNDRRLLDHDFARGVRILPLHFLVRFFPESIKELRDAQAAELFYQQARNSVAKGAIEVNAETAAKLAALSLQISIGDFVCDSVSRNYLRGSSFNTYSNPLEHSQLYLCEDRVCGEHQQLIGLSRGDAILSYMRQIESIPSYGVHFYEVRDRANISYYLGISRKGIAQYEYRNKSKPTRVFFWKQLENLYFRERKFSIEVHDPKRVVSALNSFNLYEGAIQDSDFRDELLLQAISEETTQVSVSRRTFSPGNVSIYVWVAESQSLCKSIWSMAIAQHQFYLDRKTTRVKEGSSKSGLETADLVGELSRSCISLSTHSSSPNLSRSGSHSSLQHHSHTEESASTESLHAARMEMLSALQQKLEGLQEGLNEKSEELKLLCLREGELTGELPPEYPLKPGEPPPVVRKRVGTSFMLDEALINKIINKQEETVASLELEYDIQAKIVSAALRLANESSLKKGLRKQRKNSYHQASQRLKAIEQRLQQAKARQAQVLANNASTMPKMKKKPRPVSDGEAVVQDDSCISFGNLKETSFVEIFSPLSQTTNIPPLSKSKPGGTGMALHSAPPSPQRSSSGGTGTPSESSSHLSGNKSSRSSSPSRPTSGYIPSVVYTRSQYRTQHYPTLSTRGQSVPCESLEHQRSFTGGLYNLPHQRTSLASHSLDDLDTSSPTNSPLVNPVKNPSIVHLPPHPHVINYQYTPHHHHFKHHHHPSHLPARRPRNSNESSDRFGSLDRRRANSGRYESRSMEHLDSLPPYPSESPSPVSSPAPQPSVSTNHAVNDFTSLPNSEQETHPWTNQPVIQDAVDGALPLEYSLNTTPGNPSPHFREIDKESGESVASRGLVRSASGRSYVSSMDVNFTASQMNGNARNYSTPVETLHHLHEPQSCSVNQENIPPSPYQSITAETLIPLRASNPHRGHSKREGYVTNLRSTASVNAADHLRPFRFTTNDLTPLRPTKSSCDLPPLKPTNGRQWDSTHQNTHHYQSPAFRCHDDYNHRIFNGAVEEEPLISLAEGARLRKEQREKEWYEASTEENSKSKLKLEQNKSHTSVHNLSTSSVGSSESSGSVFHSVNDPNESLNTTLNNSTISASLNATLTVISAGSYQPSREISKPFEMSDFYKYSTKFRRKSSSSGGQYENGGQESPNCNNTLSPTLPPRTSQIAVNVNCSSNSPAEFCIPPPSSPSLVAQQSSPAPQQKGIYQPLTPLTCKPLEDEAQGESPGCEHLGPGMSSSRHKTWEATPVHQAVPVNITAKRSATLV